VSHETIYLSLYVQARGALRRELAVPGHQVGDSRLMGGRPPSALWRRRVL
jgi:hypothetical protein